MKNSVILKSFSSGISVIMDDSIEFEELLEIIATKFKEADSFFKNAAVAISLEGRVLSDTEERRILEAITSNSRIRVLCLMGKDENKNIKFTGIHENITFQKDENCAQFYRGTLKDGESIETDKSIVILGDVNEGCAVYSEKDIVILGCLLGEAHAGVNGDKHHFVVALSLNPQSLSIGKEYVYAVPQKKSFFKFASKDVSKIAFVKNDELIVEAVTSELLENFTL